VNGAVPDETLILAHPSHAALQVGPEEIAEAVSVFHALTVIVSFCTHPAASVIVIVYVPIHCPEMLCVVCPPGDQRYVYEPVPPLGFAVALPSQILLHEALDTKTFPKIGAGALIVTGEKRIHVLESVTCRK